MKKMYTLIHLRKSQQQMFDDTSANNQATDSDSSDGANKERSVEEAYLEKQITDIVGVMADLINTGHYDELFGILRIFFWTDELNNRFKEIISRLEEPNRSEMLRLWTESNNDGSVTRIHHSLQELELQIHYLRDLGSQGEIAGYNVDISPLQLKTEIVLQSFESAPPLKYIDEFMQLDYEDTLLIKETERFFRSAIESIDKILAIDPERYAFRADGFGYELVEYMFNNSFRHKYTPEAIKALQANISGLKEEILAIRERIFIIDRKAYYEALDRISDEIVNDMQMGHKVGVKLPDKPAENLRSSGYVAFLIMKLVEGKCKERSLNTNQITISNAIDSNASVLYVMDDFILTGHRMKINYEAAQSKARIDQEIKCRSIASVDGFRFEDGTSPLSVYQFPDNALFTSTTSDCDYTFTESRELQDIVEKMEQIPELEEEVNGSSQGYVSKRVYKPKLMDQTKMQSLKPYYPQNRLRVNSKLRKYYNMTTQ